MKESSHSPGKIAAVVAVCLGSFLSPLTYAQTLPQKDGRPLVPDEWLFSPGQSFHYRFPATNNGRRLLERAPSLREAKAIEKIERYFSDIPSKAYLLGDGDNIIKVSFKAPASSTTTLLSASIDKTVTAMSGVLLCATEK
jgi:hypothetical protein